MTVVNIILQGLLIFIFTFISVYTWMFAKKGTGMRRDYFATCVLIFFLLWRLS